MAGINGQGNKKKREKKMHVHPVRAPYERGTSERVYIPAVADRVNVGKDEGLRFSGWIELERERGTREDSCRGDRRLPFEGDGKKFRAPPPPTSPACPCAWTRGFALRHVYLCDTLRIRVNDTWLDLPPSGYGGGIKRARADGTAWFLSNAPRATSTHARYAIRILIVWFRR